MGKRCSRQGRVSANRCSPGALPSGPRSPKVLEIQAAGHCVVACACRGPHGDSRPRGATLRSASPGQAAADSTAAASLHPVRLFALVPTSRMPSLGQVSSAVSCCGIRGHWLRAAVRTSDRTTVQGTAEGMGVLERAMGPWGPNGEPGVRHHPLHMLATSAKRRLRTGGFQSTRT